MGILVGLGAAGESDYRLFDECISGHTPSCQAFWALPGMKDCMESRGQQHDAWDAINCVKHQSPHACINARDFAITRCGEFFPRETLFIPPVDEDDPSIVVKPPKPTDPRPETEDSMVHIKKAGLSDGWIIGGIAVAVLWAMRR